MSIIARLQGSDSPLIETVTYGHTEGAGSTIRPAEIHWHMVLLRQEGEVRFLVVGPWSKWGVVEYGDGAQLIWIKLRLGVYMPHLPTRRLLDSETPLPQAAGSRVWFKGAAREVPTHENVDTFIDWLVRDGALAVDPVVSAALNDRLDARTIAERTLRHRFLQSAGLSHGHILQFVRAQRAAALLRAGMPILDTVEEAGYFDQPHLTRSIKHFTGYTPAQLLRQGRSG